MKFAHCAIAFFSNWPIAKSSRPISVAGSKKNLWPAIIFDGRSANRASNVWTGFFAQIKNDLSLSDGISVRWQGDADQPENDQTDPNALHDRESFAVKIP